MEQDIHTLLSNLESGIKSFKEEEAKKIHNQEKRLDKLEKNYSVMGNRPFISAERIENDQYKKYLEEYLRKGITSSPEIKSNGFPLQNTLVNSLHDRMKKLSPMRRIASVDTISTDYITYIGNGEALEAQWVSDENEYDADDNAKDHIITTNITTYELFTQPRTTQKVLDDPAIDAERWLIEQAAIAFTQLENETFITGDGENKPHGILKYNDCHDRQICKITTAEASKITAEDILQLYYSLPREFSVNGTFLMNSATIQIVRGLKYEQTGHYMFQPSLCSGEPDTLMGIPVVECAEMPIIPTKSKTPCPCPIIFGDFKRGYQIVDRNEMRVLRDPYSAKPYISFYMTKRVGGEVINPNAFVLLEMKSS